MGHVTTGRLYIWLCNVLMHNRHAPPHAQPPVCKEQDMLDEADTFFVRVFSLYM